MKSELELHQQFISYLNKIGIPFVHSRTDRKTSTTVGDPDFFLFWCSHVVAIEIKVGKNKLSAAQEKRIAYLRKAGNKVVIAYSLQECVEAAKGILCQSKDKNDIQPAPEREEGHVWIDLELGSLCLKCHSAVQKGLPKPNTACFGKPEPPTQNPAEGQKESPSEPAPKFYIATWGGKPYVFEDIGPHPWEGKVIRPATQYDLLNINRR